jgi:hypothetical protein
MAWSLFSSIGPPSTRHLPNVPSSIRFSAPLTRLRMVESLSASWNSPSFSSSMTLASLQSPVEGASLRSRAFASARSIVFMSRRSSACSRCLYSFVFKTASISSIGKVTASPFRALPAALPSIPPGSMPGRVPSAACLEQEPGTPFGLVDPNFNQAGSSNVLMFFADTVRLAQARSECLAVLA